MGKISPNGKTVTLFIVFVMAYALYSSVSAISDFESLQALVEGEVDRNGFFDSEILTNPAWVGFLNSFGSGIFMSVTYMQFEPHDPLLKVNYSQYMAELLMHHALIPYLIGSFVGCLLTVYLFGGIFVSLFVKDREGNLND